jgi:hypothetical protein
MQNNENDRQSSHTYPVFTWVLSCLAIALVGATVFSLVQLVREQRNVRDLAAARDGLSAALNQTRSQLQAVETKLDALGAAPRAVKGQLAPVRIARTPVRRPATRPQVEDPRWERLQAQLSEQQKQIADTREEAGKTGADLRGRLDSTRDELNGSIAKTHDELVQLQKRGESNFYEFKLAPSKQFERVGPLGVALHKVNLKHKYFDMSMMVDDFKLDKKHVNLYEPVWINLSDRPQPVQLVVNRIDKNQVTGYISEPKYKKSQLAAAAPAETKPESLQTR